MNPFRALSTTERTTLHRLRERGATIGDAQPDPQLAEGIGVPAHIASLERRQIGGTATSTECD